MQGLRAKQLAFGRLAVRANEGAGRYGQRHGLLVTDIFARTVAYGCEAAHVPLRPACPVRSRWHRGWVERVCCGGLHSG